MAPDVGYCVFKAGVNMKAVFRLVQFWTPSPVTQRWGERVPLSPALRDRRGGPELDYISADYYGFNANISFTFQAIKNLYAHPTYLCFGPFCKFFGDF